MKMLHDKYLYNIFFCMKNTMLSFHSVSHSLSHPLSVYKGISSDCCCLCNNNVIIKCNLIKIITRTKLIFSHFHTYILLLCFCCYAPLTIFGICFCILYFLVLSCFYHRNEIFSGIIYFSCYNNNNNNCVIQFCGFHSEQQAFSIILIFPLK